MQEIVQKSDQNIQNTDKSRKESAQNSQKAKQSTKKKL